MIFQNKNDLKIIFDIYDRDNDGIINYKDFVN